MDTPKQVSNSERIAFAGKQRGVDKAAESDAYEILLSLLHVHSRTGGHGRDRTRDAERGERGAEGALEALRAEERDG